MNEETSLENISIKEEVKEKWRSSKQELSLIDKGKVLFNHFQRSLIRKNGDKRFRTGFNLKWKSKSNYMFELFLKVSKGVKYTVIDKSVKENLSNKINKYEIMFLFTEP